jgi:hypothetical protein
VRLFAFVFAELHEALAAVCVHEVVHVATQNHYFLSFHVGNQANWTILLLFKSHRLHKVLSEVISGLLTFVKSNRLHHTMEVVWLILHAVHDLHLKSLSVVNDLARMQLSDDLSVFSHLSDHSSVILIVQVSLGTSLNELFILEADYAIAVLIVVNWVFNWRHFLVEAFTAAAEHAHETNSSYSH